MSVNNEIFKQSLQTFYEERNAFDLFVRNPECIHGHWAPFVFALYWSWSCSYSIITGIIRTPLGLKCLGSTVTTPEWSECLSHKSLMGSKWGIHSSNSERRKSCVLKNVCDAGRRVWETKATDVSTIQFNSSAPELNTIASSPYQNRCDSWRFDTSDPAESQQKRG